MNRRPGKSEHTAVAEDINRVRGVILTAVQEQCMDLSIASVLDGALSAFMAIVMSSGIPPIAARKALRNTADAVNRMYAVHAVQVRRRAEAKGSSDA